MGTLGVGALGVGGVGGTGAGGGVGVPGVGAPHDPAPGLLGLQLPPEQVQDPQHSEAVHCCQAFLQSALALAIAQSKITKVSFMV